MPAMFWLGKILIELLGVLDSALVFYMYILIGAVILSWVNADPYNPIVRLIRQLTEPVFLQCRRVMPAAIFRLGIDLSPMVAWFGVIVVRNLLLFMRVELIPSLFHMRGPMAVMGML